MSYGDDDRPQERDWSPRTTGVNRNQRGGGEIAIASITPFARKNSRALAYYYCTCHSFFSHIDGSLSLFFFYVVDACCCGVLMELLFPPALIYNFLKFISTSWVNFLFRVDFIKKATNNSPKTLTYIFQVYRSKQTKASNLHIRRINHRISHI